MRMIELLEMDLNKRTTCVGIEMMVHVYNTKDQSHVISLPIEEATFHGGKNQIQLKVFLNHKLYSNLVENDMSLSFSESVS